MREALRQTWISQAMDRYRVAPSNYIMDQIISEVDETIAKLSNEEVSQLL